MKYDFEFWKNSVDKFRSRIGSNGLSHGRKSPYKNRPII